MSRHISLLSVLWWSFIPLFFLTLTLRGLPGNYSLAGLNTLQVKDHGPFELSPERGRFALTYALAEYKSPILPPELARFATPDVGFFQGRYVSLFAPAVSFLVLPGYLIGRSLGSAQVGTFAIIALAAFLNFRLLIKISEFLGSSLGAARLSAFLFLFATPAYAYAVTLYQHHITVLILLTSLWLWLRYPKSPWALAGIWGLYVFSWSVDYPNFFLLSPLAFATLPRVISLQIKPRSWLISIAWPKLLSFAGMILPLAFFCGFNYWSYSSPFRLAGTVPYIAHIGSDGSPIFPTQSIVKTVEDLNNLQPPSAVGYFNTRNLVNGLYIHLFSPDRSLIVYAPVVILSLLGIKIAWQKLPQFNLLISLLLVNLLIYSLWGDPWGGWAFGSRYLIPGYAVSAIILAQVFSAWHSRWWLLPLCLIVGLYSLAVNTLGALTTNALPPRIQVLQLEALSGQVQKYTWQRNLDYLFVSGSKSFLYRTVFAPQVPAWQYASFIYLALASLFIYQAFTLPKNS